MSTVQFMHFSAIFAMLPVLATSVTPCDNSTCLLGYKRTFLVVSSLAEGRSKPVPKTRNGCFHQQWLT